MNRHFWILTSGQAVSMLGSSFGQIALAWMVYELTGSKLAMGTIFLMGLVPETILRLLGAPLADRWNRVYLLRAMDLAQVATYSLMTLLTLTGTLQIWHLYAIAVAAGLARALYVPTFFALIPSVVPSESLVKANSFSQTLLFGVNMVGPAVAGALVSLAGAVPALAIDSLSYGLSALSLFLVPAALGQVEQKAAASTSYTAQLTEGIRFYKQTPALLLMMLTVAASNFAMTPASNMLVPFVREQLGAGADAAGLVTAALPAGAVLGGLLLNWLGEPRSRRFGMTLPLAFGGATVMAMALVGQGQIWLALLLWFVNGLTIGFFNPQNATLHQRMVPADLRGRVQAVRLTIGWGVQPAATFLGSFIAERSGLPAMLLVVGLVNLVVPLMVLAAPALRAVENPPANENSPKPAHTPAA